MMDLPTMSEVEIVDDPGFCGVVLRLDGRLILADEGKGLSVQLDAPALAGLCKQCALVALYLRAQGEAVAEEAADDLRRITGSAGHA